MTIDQLVYRNISEEEEKQYYEKYDPSTAQGTQSDKVKSKKLTYLMNQALPSVLLAFGGRIQYYVGKGML